MSATLEPAGGGALIVAGAGLATGVAAGTAGGFTFRSLDAELLAVASLAAGFPAAGLLAVGLVTWTLLLEFVGDPVAESLTTGRLVFGGLGRGTAVALPGEFVPSGPGTEVSFGLSGFGIVTFSEPSTVGVGRELTEKL
jgi:hypothetical protein